MIRFVNSVFEERVKKCTSPLLQFHLFKIRIINKTKREREKSLVMPFTSTKCIICKKHCSKNKRFVEINSNKHFSYNKCVYCVNSCASRIVHNQTQ